MTPETRRPRRISARLVDRALVAAVLLAAVIGTAVWARISRPGLGVVVLVVAQGIVQAGALLRRRSHPGAVFAVVAAAFAAYQPLATPSSALALLIAVYALGAYAPRRTSVQMMAAGGAALIGAIVVSAEVLDSRTSLSDLASFGPVFVAVWAIGTTVGTRRAYTASLEDRARLLEEQRVEHAQRAVAEERARIARELHDVVAHNVSLMVVQAGGARRVIDRSPGDARDALGTIEETGRRALNELRRSLGVLRSDAAEPLQPQPGLADVRALVEETRAAGMQVELSIEGEERAMPEGAGLSAYRIVQEALTNVLKHAGAARAAVVLRYEPDAVSIEVTDDGAGRVGAVNGSGHGLVGIRERVALYGGEVHAGPRVGGGFTVRARLPITEDAS